MTKTSLASRTRWFAAGRLVWGAVLSVPGRVLCETPGSARDNSEADFACACSAFAKSEAGVSLAIPTSSVLRAGAAVDGIHALSMLPLAAISARYRRPALLSAAIATAGTCAGLVILRTSFRESSSLREGARDSALHAMNRPIT